MSNDISNCIKDFFQKNYIQDMSNNDVITFAGILAKRLDPIILEAVLDVSKTFDDENKKLFIKTFYEILIKSIKNTFQTKS